MSISPEWGQQCTYLLVILAKYVLIVIILFTGPSYIGSTSNNLQNIAVQLNSSTNIGQEILWKSTNHSFI